MRIIWKLVKAVLVVAAALVVLSAGAALGYREYLQHLNVEDVAIRTPNGIDEGMYVPIGGVDQWIQIRGQNRDNPVLLLINGGPGASWLWTARLFVPWERDFTLVQWDQRGAGRTFERSGSSIADTMTLDRMAADGIEVSQFLTNHLHKPKIILLGHSWGTILGIHMIKARPDLFYAFVGTSQINSMAKMKVAQYTALLESAGSANDTATVTELESAPLPHDCWERFRLCLKWQAKYGAPLDRLSLPPRDAVFAAPNYSFADIYYQARGFQFSQNMAFGDHELGRELYSVDLPAFATDFDVPIFFFEGTADGTTPIGLAREYFDLIQAPRKEFVPFEGGNHFAFIEMRDRFLAELDARVRPLALQP